MLHIDGLAIEQVLVNLIDNAIEYSPADKPIEILVRSDGKSVTWKSPTAGLVCRRELSSGSSRNSSAPRRKAAAVESGWGWQSARGSSNAHHGQISATNRPVIGAVFRVSIPLEGTQPKVDASG